MENEALSESHPVEGALIAYAPRRLPVYIIQPRSHGEIPSEVPILLGEKLATTMAAVGKTSTDSPGSKISIHVRSDMPGGVSLQGLRSNNAYSMLGGIGGIANFTETICSTRGLFRAVIERDRAFHHKYGLLVSMLTVSSPTLVISRVDVENRVALELKDGNVNPEFGTVALLAMEFRELVGKVRNGVPSARYLYLE